MEENYEEIEEMEEDYKESLKGVSVKDNENGFEIYVIGVESGILGKYQIDMNIKGYTEMELFDICYKVAEEIRREYYSVDKLTRDMIVEIVRSQFIK